MNESCRLLLDHPDDARMAVPSGAYGDAGSEIQKSVSIHVGDHHAFGLVGYQWIGTAVRRGNVGSVLGEDCLSFWARERRMDSDPGILGHSAVRSQARKTTHRRDAETQRVIRRPS